MDETTILARMAEVLKGEGLLTPAEYIQLLTLIRRGPERT